MTTIDAVRDPHWAVVLQILSPRSSSLRSGPSLALERGFPATSRNELKDGCTTLKWNRWRDVGQAGSLRATQRVPRLPSLSAAIAAVGRLTIGRSLPSCPTTGAPPAWRTTYSTFVSHTLVLFPQPHACIISGRTRSTVKVSNLSDTEQADKGVGGPSGLPSGGSAPSKHAGCALRRLSAADSPHRLLLLAGGRLGLSRSARQRKFVSHPDKFCVRSRTHLAHYLPAMNSDGDLAGAEFPGGLLIRQSRHDEGQTFP